MEKLRKAILILHDFHSDSKIGNVLNMPLYIETRCTALGIPEFKDALISLINKSTQDSSCKIESTEQVCSHCGNIFNGTLKVGVCPSCYA
jgi:hypothetical protein